MERKVRAVAATLLLVIALLVELPGSWEGLFAAIGVALFLTALLRYCPIKRFLGRRGP